ncbi:MAG TPA: hypothetical protein VMT47_09275, partial [Polyangia bacterium]|nr:hypothetical protein [Polyangia bacterium]
MNRQTMILTALALASLGAACTVSDPIVGTTSSAGAAGPAVPTPFVPFEPSDPPVQPLSAAPGGATTGSAGASTENAAGAAGSGGASACDPGGPPVGPPIMSPFRPDLSGPVTSAAVPPRPLSGGTLLVLAGDRTAVAADSDRDRVFIVDLAARTLSATVELSAGDEPGRLVQDAAGDVHVALRGGGAIVTFDPSSGIVKAREPVCAAPRGLAYEPAKDLVHVACADGQLVSLHASGGVYRTLTLDRDLRDVVATKTGALLVSTFRRADAIIVDENGNVMARQRPPTRHGISAMGLPHSLSPAVAWRMVPLGDGGALMLHQRGVDDQVDPVAGGYAGVKGCDGIVESAATVVAPDGTMTVSPGLGM